MDDDLRRHALRTGFDLAAEDYQRTRPVCPPELFDDLMALAGLEAGNQVIEIGCGTGQATVPLAERGLAVTAIELGANLAAVARRRRGGHRGPADAACPRALARRGTLMDRAQAHIRPYRPADIDALYQICLLTGDAGQDATSLHRDPKLLGHCFAAPYGLFEPSLAFVAEDASGVAGYIVGALDSQAFEQRLESDWWPDLRTRYPEPPPGLPSQRWTPDQRLAYVIHHPWRTPDELTVRYPSHLHINLLPRLQARGYGRQLIKTLTAALCDQGSRGVHLYVTPGNQRATGFYRHIGFTELPATGAHLFGMDLRITS